MPNSAPSKSELPWRGARPLFCGTGQQQPAAQRALEAEIAVAGGAHVILLDEPTAGMSHAETERAVALIRRLTEGRTLLIVEHDMSGVFGLADRISVLV